MQEFLSMTDSVEEMLAMLKKYISFDDKSNIEAKGITFAIQSFVLKLSGAVSSSLSVGLLGLPIVGWVTVKADNFEQLAAMGVTQTPQALDAFWFIYAMIPTLGYLAAYIAWRFYNLKDKDVQQRINNLVLEANELRYQAYLKEQKAINKMNEILHI